MTPFQKRLFNTACYLRTLGIIAVPVSKKKRPVVEWRNGNKPPPSPEEIKVAFGYSFTTGLSILCGAISGNIEVIDVDCKNDLAGNLMRRLFDLLKKTDPALAAKLVIAKTRSGGYHLFYRCEEVDCSRHLARRPATPAELKNNPELQFVVLIETRGAKGTACIAPTEGYIFLRGNMSSIPTITPDERKKVLDTARHFNQVQEKIKENRPVIRKAQNSDPSFSPIDDYNKRGEIVELLKKHGWKVTNDTNPEKTVFLRPGETDKDSSGNFNHRLRLFSTFSPNTRFETETAYSPAEVFFILEHSGDKKNGVKALLQLGFGKSYREQELMRQSKKK